MDFRKVLREESLKPFHKHKGTPYPTSQADIDFHRASKFPKPIEGPFLNQTEATAELMHHNDEDRKLPLPRQEQTAIDNLLDLVLDVEDGCRWGPDLAVKCFRDLDLVFFGGRLQGHVCVDWYYAPTKWFAKMRPGLHKETLGMTYMESNTTIRLNAIMFVGAHPCFTTFETMFSTLLHEMVHAYENIVICSESDLEVAHGPHFQTRINVVHERAMRLLNLGAMCECKSYRQHHFFGDGIEWDEFELSREVDSELSCGMDCKEHTDDYQADDRESQAVHVVPRQSRGDQKRPKTRKGDKGHDRKTDRRQCVVM